MLRVLPKNVPSSPITGLKPDRTESCGLLRLRVDRVPMDNIDGYRPDDSDYDPTAQGFELLEVEEEIRSVGT